MTAARIKDTKSRSPRVVGIVKIPTRSASGYAPASQVMTASVDASSAKKIAVGKVQAIHAMLSMANASLQEQSWWAPSPRSYGEKVGVRGHRHAIGLAESPPHPASRFARCRPLPARGER